MLIWHTKSAHCILKFVAPAAMKLNPLMILQHRFVNFGIKTAAIITAVIALIVSTMKVITIAPNAMPITHSAIRMIGFSVFLLVFSNIFWMMMRPLKILPQTSKKSKKQNKQFFFLPGFVEKWQRIILELILS